MRYILIAALGCHALAVHAVTRYVAVSGGHSPPFTNWVGAATNIQDALDVSADADVVLVSNGVYELSAQVSITKGITLRSVNGAESAIIDGKHVTRCLYIAHSNALAEGFTLRNGSNYVGAGVFIEEAGTVRNSIICSNAASVGGGGVRCDGGGLVESCVIMGNLSSRNSTSGGGGSGVSCSFGGTIRNCLITDNLACDGGGVRCEWGGSVQNCTVVGNTATNLGGGLFLISGAQWGGNPAFVENSIIAYNSAPGGADHYSLGINNSLTYCCFDGSWIGGDGNIDAPVDFVSLVNRDYHLLPWSPCVDAGTNTSSLVLTDLDGFPRVDGERVDIGAFEHSETVFTSRYVCLAITGNPAPFGQSHPYAYGTNYVSSHSAVSIAVTGPCYTAIDTRQVCVGWEGFGSVPTGGPHDEVSFVITNDSSLTWKWATEYLLDVRRRGAGIVSMVGGWYQNTSCVEIAATPYENASFIRWEGTIPFGQQTENPLTLSMDQPQNALAVFSPQTLRVSGSSANPLAPYSTWATAATTVWDAVSLATDGDIILVTNGTYLLSAQIVLTNAITVSSVNGPAQTIIDGRNTNRCFYLDHPEANLLGLTLANGWADVGGGIYAGSCGTISNCLITTCRASSMSGFGLGGGVYVERGLLTDCTLSNNYAQTEGGGVRSYSLAQLTGCTITHNTAGREGGGVYAFYSTLDNCLIRGNAAGNDGGGVFLFWGGNIRRCKVLGNQAGRNGGGVYFGTGGIADNSIMSGNSAGDHGGGTYVNWVGTVRNSTLSGNNASICAGGAYCRYGGLLINAILYNNSAPSNSNWYVLGGAQFLYCCASPAPTGDGNISEAPLFLDADYRLQDASPCIDSGTNILEIACDVDSIARPLDGNNDGVPRHDIGAYEYVHPLSDSDGDGLADTNELNDTHTNPTNPDTDSDGQGDGNEIAGGTLPLDPESFLGIVNTVLGSAHVEVTWQTVYGKGYCVERATDLSTDSWIACWPFVIYEVGEFPEGTESLLDFAAPTNGNVFYRVRLAE